ncbi:MAG: SDR family oxidoreductase [Nanoarchaeota archaeon]
MSKNSDKKMRILIIAKNGMLGHEVFSLLKEKGYTVFGTERTNEETNAILLDLCDNPENIIRKIIENKPTVVINCAGILKPIAEQHPQSTIQVNSLAPHILAHACDTLGSKLIHITTDCVYDGKNGQYNEQDVPSPSDFYGRSKLAGEVVKSPHLNIRTSIIGHEQRLDKYNLLDWFLDTKNTECTGFTDHYWNGLTTVQLADFLIFIIEKHFNISGTLHVYGDMFTKYELLELFKEVYHKEIKIIKGSSSFFCNRTLASLIFPSLNYGVPPLKQQLYQLKRKNNIL